MGRKSDYSKFFDKDYQKLFCENEKLKLENELLKDENRRLKLELEKHKIVQDEDCKCSSIPSSKCNHKFGISNSRKPTGRKPGATKGHKASYLSNDKVEEIKQNPKVKIVNITLGDSSRQKEPIVRYRLGFEITPVLYQYEIYPNKKGTYEIPSNLKPLVGYSNEVKTLAMDLFYERNVSTDNIVSFFDNLFQYKLSKGTIINWTKELEDKLRPETGNILRNLLKESYTHVDESQVNVEGETYNLHNVSTDLYTMQWIHKNKSHKAIEEIGFLCEYKGILVKDGTHLYDKFGNNFVSCGAHINRYLIGANKGIVHKGEENLLMFFDGLKRRRKYLLQKGYTKVNDEEYKTIYIQYKLLLEKWEQEIKKDRKDNPLYDEERKLQSRLLKDAEQHLKFMINFSLPYTNNRAETDIRGIKQRQKVGIFRTEEAAERYVTIKSCISTYKKHKINVFHAIQCALSNETIII